MKKHLLLITALLSIALINSCKEEEEAPPHIVGEWDLQNYALKNVASDYSYNEGTSFELDEVNLGITSYELELLNNRTFNRSVKFSGTLPQDDSGVWELSTDGEELTIESDDFDSEDFDVVKDENDDLWLSFPLTFGLMKNAVSDTLTQEHWDTLTNDEKNALFDGVLVDFVFVFERK